MSSWPSRSLFQLAPAGHSVSKPPPLKVFELKELVACAGREVGLRKGVYPKWVASGRMTQEQADKEIAMMETIYFLLKEKRDELCPS